MAPMSGKPAPSSRSWRGWAILAAALVAFVVLFEVLQRVAPDPPERTEIVESAPEPVAPTRPKITRITDGIEIQVGFHRTTVRLDEGDDAVDELISCLETGLDRSVAEGRLPVAASSASWFAELRHDAKLAEEVNGILGACVGLDLPVPSVPTPGEGRAKPMRLSRQAGGDEPQTSNARAATSRRDPR